MSVETSPVVEPSPEALHARLTDTILGAALEVHRALGPGLLESAYEACLVWELESKGLRVERQVAVPVVSNGAHSTVYCPLVGHVKVTAEQLVPPAQSSFVPSPGQMQPAVVAPSQMRMMVSPVQLPRPPQRLPPQPARTDVPGVQVKLPPLV